MKPRIVARRHVRKSLLVCLLLLITPLILTACGNNAQLQQQADQNKKMLDQVLVSAKNIGVPDKLLDPIKQQEQQLSLTHAPLGLFNGQSVDTYYANLSKRYTQLGTQVTGLESQSTQQLDFQASQDIQALSTVLADRQAQNFGDLTTFSVQLTTYQQNLAKAHYPKDYITISNAAQVTTQALHLMGPAHDALTSLQTVIQQLKSSGIDTTVFNQEYQDDIQSFKKASKPVDFSALTDLINSQLNQTSTVSTSAIPYVGQIKINQFKADIEQIKQYGNTDTTEYQQQLDADQKALTNAKTTTDFLKVSTKIDTDIAAIRLPLTKAQSNYLLQQFHQEVKSWGLAHEYHDPLNGENYPLDYEYDLQGIGSDADAAVQAAQTLDDYQSATDLINNDMLHLHMMEQDYSDTTAFDQAHQSDLTLMNYYGINGANEVFVVSLVQQSMRYYQNGKLVRSFHITSGQYDKPSLPGYWQIFVREAPTLFKSGEPKGSAFWYPDTKINFAMEYHEGGYFFHDSWWRYDYGVGTNFPHNDSSGNQSFSGNGSHGCINMAENDISWLYANSHYNTQVLLY